MEEISLAGKKIFEIFGFEVTNTFFLTLVLSIGLVSAFFVSFRKIKLVPDKVQNFFEWILETLYNFVDSITKDNGKTKEIFPIAASFFLLILSSNLLELLPGLGVFPFLRAPSSDLNFTFALSLFAMSFINIMAFKKLGLFSYSKKFLNFKNPIYFFVGFLETISEISRVLSLAIRLFGNLFAGEVLLMVTSFLFAYVLPLPFLLLEVLVGFIQAFIFFTLVVIFYTTSTQLEHGE